MICAKMSEPIDLLFGLWLRWAKWSTSSIAFARWRQCVLPSGHIGGRAHWRHLANTIELFVCGSDAALHQITL